MRVLQVALYVVLFGSTYGFAPLMSSKSFTALNMAANSEKEVRSAINKINILNFEETLNEVEAFLRDQADAKFYAKQKLRLSDKAWALGLSIPEGFATVGGRAPAPATTSAKKEAASIVDEIAPEPTEEPTSEDTAEEPVSEAIAEEVTPEPEPVAEEIAPEPVAEEAAPEPAAVAEEAAPEIVAEETAPEPVVDKSASEPVAEETASEPVADEATTGPELVTHEQIAEEAKSEAITGQAAPEPVSREAVLEPEPVMEEVTAEPMAEEVTNDLTAEEASSEPITEEVAPEAVGEEAPEPISEEPTSEHIAKEAAPEPVEVTGKHVVAEPKKITTALIKELRELTGAGMMDCKKALTETGGDVDQAIENMRTSGALKAAKKATKVAAEGQIIVKEKEGTAALVEVNCQTDFVAKDATFLEFANKVAEAAAESKPSIEDLQTQFEDERVALVAKIGENINIRRVEYVEGAKVATYIHNGGKIGVVVAGEGEEQVLKNICMHVCASSPDFLNPDDVPEEVVEKERAVQIKIAMEEGKPEEIAEKMVTGRMKKYTGEVSLTGQPFVMEPKKSVSDVLKETGSTVSNFIRMEVGAGIEKKEELSFAEEVAAMAAGK